jgi:hypothetical protein
MTTTDIITTARPAILPRLAAGFASFMTALASYSTAAACARECERLMALSDEQLAARGLTRDGIVRHAFARYIGAV